MCGGGRLGNRRQGPQPRGQARPLGPPATQPPPPIPLHGGLDAIVGTPKLDICDMHLSIRKEPLDARMRFLARHFLALRDFFGNNKRLSMAMDTGYHVKRRWVLGPIVHHTNVAGVNVPVVFDNIMFKLYWA